jgi:hypothetical protein
MAANGITVIVWLSVVSLVGLNGFAAGVAAALHIWVGGMRRRRIAILASVVSGFLPASMLVVTGGLGRRPVSFFEDPFVVAAAFAIALGFAALLSFPGATIVARKLDGHRDAVRAFE